MILSDNLGRHIEWSTTHCRPVIILVKDTLREPKVGNLHFEVHVSQVNVSEELFPLGGGKVDDVLIDDQVAVYIDGSLKVQE